MTLNDVYDFAVVKFLFIFISIQLEHEWNKNVEYKKH
jgi:hypothetical protein